MVVGHLKPIILLPIGTITGLSPEQLEAILAHELAHIARHDFLVNILQSVVDIVFFYHPGIWWISKVIREEREHCCDDLAVAYNKDSLTFAKALAQLQERDWLQPELAVAINGKKSSLQYRIERLLDFSENTKSLKTTFQEGFFTAVLLTLAILGFSFTLHQVSQEKQKENNTNTEEVASTAKEGVINEETVARDTTKNDVEELTRLNFTMADGRYVFARLDSSDNVVELFIEGIKITPTDFDKNKEVLAAIKKNIYQLNKEQMALSIEEEMDRLMREQERVERQALRRLREQEAKMTQEVRELVREEQIATEKVIQKELAQRKILLQQLEIEKQQMALRIERERKAMENAVKAGEITKSEMQERMLEFEKESLAYKAKELAVIAEINSLKIAPLAKVSELKGNLQSIREEQIRLKEQVAKDIALSKDKVREQAAKEKKIYAKFQQVIVPEMIKDGLIKSEKDHIQFIITDTELILNSKVQEAKLQKKYLKLLKKNMDVKLENEQSFEVHYHTTKDCE
jgi:hypothetical protein